MPSQALSRLQKLAGLHMPARYETLGNLLETCLNPDRDTTDIKAAVELDPAILGAFLSFKRTGARLKTWHREIPPAFLSALATAMAQQYLCDPPDDDNARGRLLAWRHAVLHSLLARELAGELDSVDPAEARLARPPASLGGNLTASLGN
ncbi:MAG: hypothetical protein HUJ31_00920, partial [Pseudomonadales bacterium]|nr:hypothetical protein [Pseudomonadales bacterium]